MSTVTRRRHVLEAERIVGIYNRGRADARRLARKLHKRRVLESEAVGDAEELAKLLAEIWDLIQDRSSSDADRLRKVRRTLEPYFNSDAENAAAELQPADAVQESYRERVGRLPTTDQELRNLSSLLIAGPPQYVPGVGRPKGAAAMKPAGRNALESRR